MLLVHRDCNEGAKRAGNHDGAGISDISSYCSADTDTDTLARFDSMLLDGAGSVAGGSGPEADTNDESCDSNSQGNNSLLARLTGRNSWMSPGPPSRNKNQFVKKNPLPLARVIFWLFPKGSKLKVIL